MNKFKIRVNYLAFATMAFLFLLTCMWMAISEFTFSPKTLKRSKSITWNFFFYLTNRPSQSGGFESFNQLEFVKFPPFHFTSKGLLFGLEDSGGVKSGQAQSLVGDHLTLDAELATFDDIDNHRDLSCRKPKLMITTLPTVSRISLSSKL